ncbi:MAG: T9SS type A sorting domain-containing protein [Saprospirales bacterium]|nr:T9SS type A sorting domain-containing protein [Saprospirales bacterium]
MKKLILCFSFSLFWVSFLTGQTLDFAPVGAKWHCFVYDFDPPPPYGQFPHVVEVLGKELYQGKLCSKLIGVEFGTVPEPLYVYSQNDSVFYYSLLSGQFEMLYDFGAEIGESWTIGGLGAPGTYDSLTVQVDSISYMIVSGLPLKVLHLNYLYNGGYEWGKQIIAGIGNTYFLTPHYGLFEHSPRGLRCYSTGDTLLQFVPYPCDTTIIITSTEQVIEETPIIVSPNPFSDDLHIQNHTLEQDLEFFLYDLMGRLCLSTRIKQGDNRIPLPALPKGIYLWKITDNGDLVQTGKIIKAE